MGHTKTPAKKTSKFRLSDEQLFRKHSVLILANYAPTARLAYYNGLENGLQIALHEAPKAVDWRALRAATPDGPGPGPGSGSGYSDSADGGGGGGGDGGGAGAEKGGGKGGGKGEVEVEVDWSGFGVVGALGGLRRAFRRAEDEVRDGFFVPGFWSRSGAKQDLAECLRGARYEVQVAVEKCRGWCNPDLISAIEEINDRMEDEVCAAVKKHGHKDYFDLTSKTDHLMSQLRHHIQEGDKARKEFITLGKEQVAEDTGSLEKSMHRHFSWDDIELAIEKR